jgi:hypothetical protein
MKVPKFKLLYPVTPSVENAMNFRPEFSANLGFDFIPCRIAYSNRQFSNTKFALNSGRKFMALSILEVTGWFIDNFQTNLTYIA